MGGVVKEGFGGGGYTTGGIVLFYYTQDMLKLYQICLIYEKFLDK
jgi:hypothetical protein